MTLTLALLLGLCVGSFVNVLVARLPRMLERQWQQACDAHAGRTPATDDPPFNLWWPRSHCPACATPLRVRDLVPVLSYVLLRGRCAHCQAPIAWRYPAVELAVSLAWGLCAWRWGETVQTWVWAGFVTVLMTLALIDWDTLLLPDVLTQPLLWAGLISSALGWTGVSLVDALAGAVAGYLSLWAVYQVFLRLSGKEGMGAGDFKLLAALGAWLGWLALPGLVLVAALLGAVAGLLLRALGRLPADAPIPFGPALVLGALVSGWSGPGLMGVGF